MRILTLLFLVPLLLSCGAKESDSDTKAAKNTPYLVKEWRLSTEGEEHENLEPDDTEYVYITFDYTTAVLLSSGEIMVMPKLTYGIDSAGTTMFIHYSDTSGPFFCQPNQPACHIPLTQHTLLTYRASDKKWMITGGADKEYPILFNVTATEMPAR